MLVPGLEKSSGGEVQQYGTVKLSVKPQNDMIAGMVREFFAQFGLDTEDKIRDYSRFYDIYIGSFSPSDNTNEIDRFSEFYRSQSFITNSLNKYQPPANWQIELNIPLWFIKVLEAYGARFNIVPTEKKVVAQGITKPEFPWIYPSEIQAGDIFGVSGSTINSAVIRAVTGKISHLGITDGNGKFYEALSKGMSESDIWQVRKGGGDLIKLYRVDTATTIRLKAVERAKYRATNPHRYKYSLGKALQAGCRSETGKYICGYLNFQGRLANLSSGNRLPNFGKFLTEDWGNADQDGMEQEPREFCSEAVINCYFEAGIKLVFEDARFVYPNSINYSPYVRCYGQLPCFFDLDNKIKVNT